MQGSKIGRIVNAGVLLAVAAWAFHDTHGYWSAARAVAAPEQQSLTQRALVDVTADMEAFKRCQGLRTPAHALAAESSARWYDCQINALRNVRTAAGAVALTSVSEQWLSAHAQDVRMQEAADIAIDAGWRQLAQHRGETARMRALAIAQNGSVLIRAVLGPADLRLHSQRPMVDALTRAEVVRRAPALAVRIMERRKDFLAEG